MKFTREYLESWLKWSQSPEQLLWELSEDRQSFRQQNKADIVIIFKKSEKKCRSVKLISITKKILVQIFRHLEGNKGIKIREHGFVKNKSCQSNPVFSYDTVTGLCIEKKNILTLLNLLTVSFMTFFYAIQVLPETAIR